MATESSAASGSSLPSALVSPSLALVNNADEDNGGRRDLVHDVVETKKLELAPPSEPMPSPGLRMVDSMARRPPAGVASNRDVGPGAFRAKDPIASQRHVGHSGHQFVRMIRPSAS
ncbi:hypothetical protein MHU86_14138 [Fragilaria crotonensis]|nr:hypothetical protein MHU86_14138 [Fragilaria crotonensis]